MGKGTGFGVDLQSHSSGDTVPSLKPGKASLFCAITRLDFTQLPLLTLLVLSAAESVHEQDSIQSNYSTQQLPGVLMENINSMGKLFAINTENTSKTKTAMFQIQK